MLNRVGEQIREYKLLDVAGMGAFAVVYRTEHVLLEQTRAMKIIHPQYLIDKTYLQRFKAEAQVVARLQHPHIVTLYEFWIDDRGAYIVMEWMPDDTLEAYLKKHGALSAEKVYELLSQIAPALNLVHERDIVHRDLKPANILFDENEKAHLADFGLAKWLQKQTTDSAGVGVGTPAYMPPEQMGDNTGPVVTARADIYSLGVILFEMLTGQHPFGNADVVPMMLHHLRDPLPPLRTINPDLPPALEVVIQKATDKDPERRYPDVLAVLDDFRKIVGKKPPEFLSETSTFDLTETQTVKPVGELTARIYRKAGTVLENPRQLVGRDELIRKVKDLLKDNLHILLHGMGGIGKTALAGHIAENYLKDAADKGKQVIWIQPGRQDADDVFEAIAQALDKFAEIATTSGDDRIALIRGILLETDALLVIDNVWNEQAILPIMRAVPHTMPMIMTSRKAYSIDGVVLDVASLDESHALSLLSHHAKQDYADNNEAKDLCKLLGHHPYAIEMAGKRLQTYRSLSPKRLMDDAKKSPHKVVVTGKLGLQGREGIKDLIDESVDELPDNLRHLLYMMGGLHSARATLDLLVDVTGQEKDSLETGLAELERNGLVEMHYDSDSPVHYRLHDLTYSYAYTAFRSLNLNRRDIVNGVHQYTKSHVQEYDHLQFDLMNILGAVRAAYHDDDSDNLIAIMRQLVVEANYLTARSPAKAAMELLNVAIDIAKQKKNYESAHYLTAKLGNVYFQITAQYDLAVDAYTASLDFARKITDLKREAITLSLVATARFRAGMDKVEELYEQASSVAEKSGDAESMAKIYNHRSYYAIMKEPPDYEASRKYCNSAIQLAEQQGLDEYLISSLNNRSVAEKHLGRLNEALQTDLKALEKARSIDNQMWLAVLHRNVGDDYTDLNERDKAIEYYNEAIQIAYEQGNNGLIERIKDKVIKAGYSLDGLNLNKVRT